MGRWEELDKKRATQSGKSMGEFGENYSYRKKYQHDYHDSSGVKWVEPNITPLGKPIYQKGHGNESPSPVLKDMLDSVKYKEEGWPSDENGEPLIKKPYVPHVIEPFYPDKDHEGYEYTTDVDREKLEKDRNYNIPITPEEDIPPKSNLWKGLI